MRDMIKLFEDVPVAGLLPAQDIAVLLPEVQNRKLFASGVLKIEQSQPQNLTIPEIRELANAFISLIRLPDKQKMQVIQKMYPVADTPTKTKRF